MPGLKVNKKELSEIFDLDGRTISNYMSRGMPCKQARKPGQSHEYDTAEVHRWIMTMHLQRRGADHDGTVYNWERERARAQHLQAELAQLQLDQARGDVIPTEAVVHAVTAQIASARSRLLAVANKLRGRFPDLPGQALELVDELHREALAELATETMPDDVRRPLDTHLQRVASAAEADVESVG